MRTEPQKFPEVWSSDEEFWIYDSLGEMLDNQDHLNIGDLVYVGEKHPPDDVLIDADSVIGLFEEAADNVAPEECAGDWPDRDSIPPGAVEGLDQFL